MNRSRLEMFKRAWMAPGEDLFKPATVWQVIGVLEALLQEDQPMSEPKTDPTVPCELCGKDTIMTGTKRCNGCWELELRIEHNPKLAAKILLRVLEERGTL